MKNVEIWILDGGIVSGGKGYWLATSVRLDDGGRETQECGFCPAGALRYLGGWIRSLSKLKNTPKALISGQKSTLIFKKRWLFPLKKHPFFYQNTDIGWTGTRILTLDFIILCLFNGSTLGSSDINIDTNNFRCMSKVQYCWTTDSEAQSLRESLGVRATYISEGDFQPPFFVSGYKKVPFF